MVEAIKMAHNWWLMQSEYGEKLTSEELAQLAKADLRQDDRWYEIPLMPKQVHDVLRDHGKLQTPWLPGKAEEYKWVAEKDWIYRRDIKGRGPGKKVVIDFKGLDTVVDIYVNGEHVTYHNDMYLQLRLDMTKYLTKADNTMIMHFHSPYKYLEQNPLPDEWQGKLQKLGMIRKIPTDFSDYIGPKPYYTHIGIFGDVVIETIDGVEIDAMDVQAILDHPFEHGTIALHVKGFGADATSEISIEVVAPNGMVCKSTTEKLYSDHHGSWSIHTSMDVENPELWWPGAYGEHPLYEVTVIAKNRQEDQHKCSRIVAFRSVSIDHRLDPVVNGKSVKLYGANLASIDGETLCWNSERVHTLLDLVENANMNIIRIWAEGELYHDELYEECDKRGIFVWQDFFTRGEIANTQNFRMLYKQEAEQLVKRLKHHACILLWNGGNESLMWHHMSKADHKFVGMEVIDVDFRDVVNSLDPNRYYHLDSPSGGAYPNDPLGGNTHGYTNMWYIPGYDYLKWASEDTRISAPAVKSLERFLGKEIWQDGFSAAVTPKSIYPWPNSWNEYTTCFSWKKTGPVERFYDAVDVETLVYKLGAAHGLYYKETIERNRRGRPSEATNNDRFNNGYLIWKLNATWPQIYSAIIDYFLEPYIPYYMIKRAFEPVALSFDIGNHITLWAINDSPAIVEGTVRLTLFNMTKNCVTERKEVNMLLTPGESKIVMNLDEFQMIHKENVLFAELLDVDGNIIARTNEFLDIERNIDFPDAVLDMRISGNVLSITTDKIAKCVELSGNANGDAFGWMFEDNYFDLLPGEVKKVKILGKHRNGSVYAKPFYAEKQCEVLF